MTTLHPMPNGVVLVAIDIAKASNEVLIEVPGQKHRRRMTILNTRLEHDRLIALLLDLKLPIACAFEATGNYHRPIAWRLREAGFQVRLVSSMALARTREALHNGWDKNDPKDAQVTACSLIAELPELGRLDRKQIAAPRRSRALHSTVRVLERKELHRRRTYKRAHRTLHGGPRRLAM